MGVNKVKTTLEEIRLMALEKTRQGIAEKRRLSRPAAVDETIRSVQKSVGPVAKEVAATYARRITSSFLDVFNKELERFRDRVTQHNEYTGVPRRTDGSVLVYPENCKFMYTDENGSGVMVIEQPPQVRTLLINTSRKHVPMPYVVFVIHFSNRGGGFQFQSIQVGFRNEPVASLNDTLCHPHLPNFTYHNVCMGSYSGPNNPDTPADIATDVIGTFWQSVFASEFIRFKLKGKAISSWTAWENIENPLDILKAKFTEGQTIAELFRVTPSSQRQQEALYRLVGKVWQDVVADMSVGKSEELIRESSEAVLGQLLEELALQPK